MCGGLGKPIKKKKKSFWFKKQFNQVQQIQIDNEVQGQTGWRRQDKENRDDRKQTGSKPDKQTLIKSFKESCVCVCVWLIEHRCVQSKAWQLRMG